MKKTNSPVRSLILAAVMLMSSVMTNMRPTQASTQSSPSQQNAPQASGVRVAMLYKTDLIAANAYKIFLDANGYSTALLPIANDGTTALNLPAIDLFVIGADTANGNNWVGSNALSAAILSSSKPVVGLGAGGRAFFARAGLTIGATPQTRKAKSAFVTDFPTSRFAFEGPNAIGISNNAEVLLYANEVDTVAIPLNTDLPDGDRYMKLKDSLQLFLPLALGGSGAGGASANAASAEIASPEIVSPTWAYAILREGSNLLWGFGGDPTAMTDSGRKFFLNLMGIQSNKLQVALMGRTFTPSAGFDADLIAALSTSANGVHAYVQTDHALSPTERDTLQTKGVALLENVIGLTYHAAISKTTNANDAALAGLVRWAGLIPNTDKLEPAVIAGKYAPHADNGDGTVNLSVIFFSDVPTTTTETVLTSLGATFSETLSNGYAIRIAKSNVVALSQGDAVRWIQQAPQPPLPDNDVARAELFVDGVQNADVTNSAAPYFAGLSGKGVTVAVFDGGVFSDAKPDHPDLRSARLVRTAHDNSGSGHGTHVAGIVAGNGMSSTVNCPAGKAPCGNFQMRGMAPEAKISAFSSGSADLNGYKQAYVDDGALNSTHSYKQSCMAYDNTIATIDNVIRGGASSGGTAIPARPYTKSAGNAGDGVQYCTQSGWYALTGISKNAIVVGSLNPNTSFTLRSSSSKGPTWDQRIKPDVMAIGCMDSLNIATDGYINKCGTSMATPAVAGIIALMTQQYQRTFATTGTALPSTYKALLVNTATDLVGNAGYADPDFCPSGGALANCDVSYFAGPDYSVGYGVVNAKRAVDAMAAQNFVESNVSPGTTTRNFTFTVSTQTAMSFTLAWDDEAGSTMIAETASHLVNDLDLVLIDPNGNQFFPFVLAALPAPNTSGATDTLTRTNITAATTGVDRVNNVEQVVVRNNAGLAPGVWTARVTAFNLPNASTQKFSLAGDFRFLKIVDPVDGAAANAGDPTNPDKILVKLWAGNSARPGSNVSMAGAQASDFTVNINKGAYSSNASVLSGLNVGDQFWLLVQPQAPTNAGYYSMTVTWKDFGSASERRSVLFLEKTPVDRVVVIDQSGSMSEFDKMESAKNGARLYVDLTNSSDSVGVVSFDDVAYLKFGLQVNNGVNTLSNAKTAINTLTPLGSTGIGKGLIMGQDQLEALNRTEPQWRMVLLSDGMENVTPYWADATVKGRIQPSRTIVDTVAVGPSSAGQHALLAQIAQDTGGVSYHVTEPGAGASAETSDEVYAPEAPEGTSAFNSFPQTLPNKFADVYKQIDEDATKHQRFWEFRDYLNCQNDKLEWQVNVEDGMNEVLFAINWADPGVMLNLLVYDPSNSLIGVGGNVSRERDYTHDAWRVIGPKPGTWTLRLRPEKCKTTEFILFASARTNITLQAFHAGDIRDYCVGRPVPLKALLADQKMIDDDLADVFVDVLGPTREENAFGLKLFDDGQHNDSKKLDGVYANVFNNASKAGVYTAKVYAVGKSNKGVVFERKRLVTFVVRPCVAYIWHNDSGGTLLYEKLLEDHGLSVDLIKTSEVTGTAFNKFALVVVGNDTGYGYKWYGGNTGIKVIAQYGVPVIGNGAGGGSFFHELGLNIDWGQSWVNTNAEVVGVVNPSDAAWKKVYPVAYDPKTLTVQLYKESVGLEVYNGGVPVKNIASSSADPKQHFPIAQQLTAVGGAAQPYLLWGFFESPRRMTESGRQVYVNLAWTMRK